MKIFWSWQSDTPGKIGRFLVRDALRDAIEELKEPPDFEEPTSRETREALHLDQDIQGVTGSPDLARTILEKIDRSDVVVADVTLVGRVVDASGTAVGPKQLINSNVAIELGYALRAVGDRKILLVFNERYGKHEDLPFDLRHKGGAIVFDLAPDEADSKHIQEQRKRLKERFVLALKPMLQASISPAAFPETPSTFNKAAYFGKGRVLARAGTIGRDQVTYAYQTESFCYLRLIPVRPLSAPLPLSMLKEAAQQSRLLSRNFSTAVDHNEFGAIAWEPESHSTDGPGGLLASTQLFQNGEIWALSVGMIVRAPQPGYPQGLTYPFLPSLMFEQVYYDTLRFFATFAVKVLGLAPPWNVELGLTGIEELHVAVDINPYERYWGPIRTSQVIQRRTLNDANPTVLEGLLLDFFSLVYDAAGHARPTGFFGFPPNRPGESR